MRNCELCGQSFVAHKPSGKAYRGKVREGRFCSRRCAHAAARKPQQLSMFDEAPRTSSERLRQVADCLGARSNKMVMATTLISTAPSCGRFCRCGQGRDAPGGGSAMRRTVDEDRSERRASGERVERENAWALREMDKRGNSRDSAWKVAGLLTKDPHARLMYTQRFRRCRRRRRRRRARKTSTARLRKSLRARG